MQTEIDVVESNLAYTTRPPQVGQLWRRRGAVHRVLAIAQDTDTGRLVVILSGAHVRSDEIALAVPMAHFMLVQSTTSRREWEPYPDAEAA